MKLAMLCIFALTLAAAGGAKAGEIQPAPAPARREAAPEARAFLAFSEVDRKAAQDALGWLGFYNGVVDGAPGRRTFEALRTYQSKQGAQADGIMTARDLAALKEGAAKAKAAVGFRIIDDAETGMRIGVPMKLLEKRVTSPHNVVFMSKDGQLELYLRKVQGGLAGHYDALIAARPHTKITYKLLKPGVFFVVASEQGVVKAYERYNADGGDIRGFTFIYAKAREKAFDPIALALANSFEPFPAAPAPAAKPAPTPSAPPTPAPPKLISTAFIVAPGVAVTALDPAQCKAPIVAGKPAKYLEPQGGLARLGGEFGAGASAPPIGQGGGELVAMSVSSRGAVTAAPAETLGPASVLAALGPSAAGAPLFDRQGRLVAFVGPIPTAPARAGVPIRAPHATISAAAFGSPGADGPDMTMSKIIALRYAGVVGVFCAP